MCLTIGDLIDLAKIGRKAVLRDKAAGISSWIGELPSEKQLDDALSNISAALCPPVPDRTAVVPAQS